MTKGDISLLLGDGGDESGSKDDGSDAAELAVKAFFKAGASGDYKKALSALKTALGDDESDEVAIEVEPEEE